VGLCFVYKQQLELYQKGGKPDRNYRISMVSEIHTKQSMNGKTQAFCRKAKTKAETKSLRNINILPRNLNVIVLS
jgi:hypothetical protein